VATEVGHLHQITGTQISAWLGRPGWSAQTRATYYGHLNAYYEWAALVGHIDRNPMTTLVRPRIPKRSPRPAREQHYRRMVMQPILRWRVAAVLAARAGLRACEIARATREDVDEDDLRVVGKGGRTDVLPTHGDVWRMIRPLPPGHLILDSQGVPYKPSALSTAFSAAATALGMKELSLHPLRHLYATELLRQGANLRVVQELMRHASPATTAIYTQVTDRERRLAIQTLSAAA
jgi:integrase